MTRKVCVVGSSSFPLTLPVGAQVVDTIREYGPDTVILTRGSGPFEKFVATVCLGIGVHCFEYPGPGGAGNFDRDKLLVHDADEVLAFLDPAAIRDPKTGTAHVIEEALAAGKPTRAASVVNDGLVWVES